MHLSHITEDLESGHATALADLDRELNLGIAGARWQGDEHLVDCLAHEDGLESVESPEKLALNLGRNRAVGRVDEPEQANLTGMSLAKIAVQPQRPRAAANDQDVRDLYRPSR